MKQILIVYDTKSGATADIAEIICEEFSKRGVKTEAKHVDDVDNLSSYDAVIVGSPIRLAKCTSKIKRFVKKNADDLASLPTAFYFACLSAIELANKPLPNPNIQFYADPSFDMKLRQRSEINFFEYLHTRWYYLKEFSKLIPQLKPVSIAFFKGRLDFSRISFTQRMIMSVALRLSDEIQKGEFFSPTAARAWAETLHSGFTACFLAGAGKNK